jgi:hypoxanthine phosphoribosyltransferase
LEYTIEVMISRDRIEKKIKELAERIERDHKGKELIFIGLLKGSVIFMSDLIKEIKLPIMIDFMSVSSYGSGTKTTGIVKILKDIDFEVKDKELFIIEDIIDSGLTLKYVKEFLLAKGARKVHICTLLDKPQRRKVDIRSDYVGFEIPDEFVVGYGLDYAQKHRNLPYVGKIVVRNGAAGGQGK